MDTTAKTQRSKKKSEKDSLVTGSNTWFLRFPLISEKKKVPFKVARTNTQPRNGEIV